MEEDVLKKYEKAGKIARSAVMEGIGMVKPGAKLLDVARRVESRILEAGAGLAFPANVSLNADAAHDTPAYDDERVFGEKDVVKVDAGAHVDGYIGDTAVCVDLSGERSGLVEASEAALEAAIAAIRPGGNTVEIGGIIEAEIRKKGFKPVENLTGHRVEQYSLHAGGEIPNVKRGAKTVFEEDHVYAIEPFATEGGGSVVEGSYVEIFGFEGKVPVRMRESRRLMTFVENNYKTLPFAERWLRKEFKSKLLLESALRELVLSGAFKQYPVLTDIEKGVVSQAEHTILIEKDGAKVLTK
ncbi:type II methionyl aminopeptidase [Candidatus Micrarchaeota archaeon]|nr:MAG: type II methionyl aminopeptidase [Candidatus Micrarchaeota archaeon]